MLALRLRDLLAQGDPFDGNAGLWDCYLLETATPSDSPCRVWCIAESYVSGASPMCEIYGAVRWRAAVGTCSAEKQSRIMLPLGLGSLGLGTSGDTVHRGIRDKSRIPDHTRV